MDQRILEQPAWLIHLRPYRESSLILEFMTRDFGRVSAVSRGARRRRKGSLLPMQFVPLKISWLGMGALKTITSIESDGHGYRLLGDQLAGGLYLNELLMRALRPLDAHERVYAEYSDALASLASDRGLHIPLRHFESCLLGEMGYAISFTECLDGTSIVADGRYRLESPGGFLEGSLLEGITGDASDDLYPGWRLLEIGQGDLGSAMNRRLARQIFQHALMPHIGNRPLQSRRLLRSSKAKVSATRGGVNFPAHN